MRFLSNSRVWFALGLAALSVVAYFPITTHDFVTYDDPSYVTKNEIVQRGWTLEGVAWAFTTGSVSNWHPLTWLSHMLDVELFGLWAGGHHLGNLLLHAANTVLVFLVFDRLSRVGCQWLGSTADQRRRLPWRAATVGALFAVHPLHVESVAWVAERKDTLSTLFWLLAMCAYGAYADRPSVWRYLAVAALMAIGLLAKPMLVTLPCALLLLDYWPLGRWQPRWALPPSGDALRRPVALHRLVLEKLPLVGLSVASAVETLLVQRLGGAVKSDALFPWSLRFWNVTFSYARYIGKTLAPRELTFFYPYPPRAFLENRWREPWLLASLVGLLTFTALCLWLGRRYRYLPVGWLWYLGTLVPVIGIVQVGDQALADRYTYIPLLGLFVIVAWGLPDLLDAFLRTDAAKRRGELALVALAAIVVPLLTVLTWRQQSHWRDSVTFYRYGIAVNPRNYVAHNNLALVLSAQGEHEAALEHYRRATDVHPSYVIAYFNHGVELETVHRPDEAEVQYRAALRVNPRYTKARHNLALLMAKQGRFAEAEPYAKRAVEEWPELADPLHTLGVILLRQGRATEALAQFNRALELNSKSAEAHSGRGLALLMLDRPQEAEAAFARALVLNKKDPKAHLGLGDLAVRAERWDEAAAQYDMALSFLPVAGETARKLAEVELRRDHKEAAADWYKESLEHDPRNADTLEAYARLLDELNRPQEAEAIRRQAEPLRSP